MANRVGRPSTIPANFIEVWNSSNNTTEAARALGISPRKAGNIASVLRGRGQFLKYFKIANDAANVTSAAPTRLCGRLCLIPPNFAEIWNSSEDASEVARRLGMTPRKASNVASRLRSSGDAIKYMRVGFDHTAFARAWNAASSVSEVAKQLGLSVDLTRDRARRVRRSGIHLKRMVRTINVHGVDMTVAEFCHMTGERKSSVMDRLGAGLSPFRASVLNGDPAQRLACIQGYRPDAGMPVSKRVAAFLIENRSSAWKEVEIATAVRGSTEAVRKALGRMAADKSVERVARATWRALP